MINSTIRLLTMSCVCTSAFLRCKGLNVNIIIAIIRIHCSYSGVILNILNEMYFMYQALYKVIIKNYL